MGEPDSNGWSGTPGDSPQPTHTICVFLPSLIFFREDTWREPRGFPGQLSFSRRGGGFCILRILDIFSACEVWFTFVYRKQEHLAVGSSGNGLTYSRGNPPSSRLPYPRLLYPYCITTWAVCQGVFYIFFRGLAPTLALFALAIWESLFHALSLPLTMIVYHRPHTKSIGNVAQIRDFSWQLFC